MFLFFTYVSAKKGKGLSSLLIQQIGRGQQKRRRGNDGQAIPEDIRVAKATAEDKQIAAFLNGSSLFQVNNNPQFKDPTMNLAEPPGGFQNLQYQVPKKNYPGTKKRPYPFTLGQGQIQSAHKSDTDLQQKFGTPGGFDDNLEDFEIERDKIIEEDDEDSQFHD